jgi:hypothetical protein
MEAKEPLEFITKMWEKLVAERRLAGDYKWG